MEIGDYVRTSSGKIAKYLGHEANKYKFDDYIYWYYEYYNDYVYDEDYEKWLEEEKVKVYKNLIDLIEVGDYVNGIKVGYIDNFKGAMREYNYIFENEEHDVGHYEEEIQSVVTKEQFGSVKYKVVK